jgi:hypothetical protein
MMLLNATDKCARPDVDANANGFEGQLATWIHWWSSVASDTGQAWPLRLQQPVRDQPRQLCRCNIDVDVGRIRQLLLRIAADIEELESATSAAGRRPPSGGERMVIRAWDGETRPSSVGELRPHFPDSPGTQMDLGPRPFTADVT